jgi:hypothetical protein
MVGVALRGDAGTAIAWIRPRGTATQKIIVAGGMARVGERTYQILLQRLARNLYPSPLGAFGEVSLEDRAGLSALKEELGVDLASTDGSSVKIAFQ